MRLLRLIVAVALLMLRFVAPCFLPAFFLVGITDNSVPGRPIPPRYTGICMPVFMVESKVGGYRCVPYGIPHFF